MFEALQEAFLSLIVFGIPVFTLYGLAQIRERQKRYRNIIQRQRRIINKLNQELHHVKEES